MKWTGEKGDQIAWQQAVLQTTVSDMGIRFMVWQERRCWVAYVGPDMAGTDHKIGDYKTERLAKAACRRKAGRIVDALKRGIRA